MPRYDLNIAIFDTIRYIVPSLVYNLSEGYRKGNQCNTVDPWACEKTSLFLNYVRKFLHYSVAGNSELPSCTFVLLMNIHMSLLMFCRVYCCSS